MLNVVGMLATEILELALAFYRHHGLAALFQQPMTLFLPLAAARGGLGL